MEGRPHWFGLLRNASCLLGRTPAMDLLMEHEGVPVTFYLLRYATRRDGVTCCCVEHRAAADQRQRVAFSGSPVAISWEQTSRKSHIWLETRRVVSRWRHGQPVSWLLYSNIPDSSQTCLVRRNPPVSVSALRGPGHDDEDREKVESGHQHRSSQLISSGDWESIAINDTVLSSDVVYLRIHVCSDLQGKCVSLELIYHCHHCPSALPLHSPPSAVPQRPFLGSHKSFLPQSSGQFT
ncbi:hypothetical protein EYF80_011905 [Liparis tanakae]|uniref:Uncharacterized protein n=1 Tax=Liparis tanakae TaxID=230148 RepID=A0A4Z2IJ47_9TELE|nr:hypothetical protein EYF80_011905 [Liparis tanakae]